MMPMRTCLALTVSLLLTTAVFAASIKPGATAQVKPNSIWFDKAAQLARWHELKKSSDDKAFAAYQDQLLGQRNALQFIYRLRVKVLSHDAKKHEAHVRMLTEGRFVGLDFYVDPDALMR
jgi:hypothetical protein